MKSFKTHADDHVILLSKVGDAALDMPDANVIIQIASSGGSRMQEAQRLGRILRPKSSTFSARRRGDADAFFYSLVSQDTHEMRFSTARQRYLVEQGYAFHVHPPDETGVCGAAEAESLALQKLNRPGLLFSRREDQLKLLHRIQDAQDDENLGEDVDKEGKMKKADDELKTLRKNAGLKVGKDLAIQRAIGRR